MPSALEEMDLGEIPYKIIFETYRETDGRLNWELFQMNADGSNQVNLTQTPDLDEMYPHASPDGTKISFVVDEGSRRDKVRSVYYMNIDGTGRVKVATNARQPCWSPDGKSIAYLRGEYERYSTREYATSDLVIYDLQSGQHKPHPNTSLHHRVKRTGIYVWVILTCPAPSPGFIMCKKLSNACVRRKSITWTSRRTENILCLVLARPAADSRWVVERGAGISA